MPCSGVGAEYQIPLVDSGRGLPPTFPRSGCLGQSSDLQGLNGLRSPKSSRVCSSLLCGSGTGLTSAVSLETKFSQTLPPMYTMALYQPRPYRSRAKDDQQHIRQTLVQLVQDLTHLSDILMSQQSPEDSINAARAVKWMSQELDAFVQYLQQHRAERGDGAFKDSTLAAAADHLRSLHVSGKIKDSKSLRNKWNNV